MGIKLSRALVVTVHCEHEGGGYFAKPEVAVWPYSTDRLVSLVLRGEDEDARGHASVTMSMPEARELLNSLSAAIAAVDARDTRTV